MADKAKRNAKRAARRRAEKAQDKGVQAVQAVQQRPQLQKLRAEMRDNIRRTQSKNSNKYQHMCRREAENFAYWASENGYKADDLATIEQKTAAAQAYVKHMSSHGVPVRDKAGAIKTDSAGNAVYRACAATSVEQYSKGVAVALGVKWTDLGSPRPSITSKTRSTGINARANAARQSAQNTSAVRFCELVGSRRGVTERLTGKDWFQSSTGQWGVSLMRDKHGKNNFHVIAPEHVEEVASYFAGKGPNDLIFGKIDSHVDTHGIRAEHARSELARYTELCKSPSYRAELRAHLIARFTDPVYGNATYLAKMAKGDKVGAQRVLKSFCWNALDNRTPYSLRGANRVAAITNNRPLDYDRLALTAVSVFCVDHWRNSTTIEYYIVSS